MLAQPGFSGGSVLVDHRDLGSVLFLELQFSQPLGGNVGDVHSQIRRSAALLAAETPVPTFAGTIIARLRVRFRRSRDSCQGKYQSKNKRAKQEAMDHSPS